MEIREKLVKFKYPLLLTLLLSLALFSLIFLAPRFVAVLAYFWPLFLSTAIFLAVVLVFAKTSSLPATDSSLDKAGEGLLDYVAGQPEHPVEIHGKSE